MDELLDTDEAANYLGVARNTLEVWRSAGRYGLQFVRVGRRIKYRKSDLDAWIESRTASSTAGQNDASPRKKLIPRI